VTSFASRNVGHFVVARGSWQMQIKFRFHSSMDAARCAASTIQTLLPPVQLRRPPTKSRSRRRNSLPSAEPGILPAPMTGLNPAVTPNVPSGVCPGSPMRLHSTSRRHPLLVPRRPSYSRTSHPTSHSTPAPETISPRLLPLPFT
jgi:hypothetical protein